jgi:hypothetical protein
MHGNLAMSESNLQQQRLQLVKRKDPMETYENKVANQILILIGSICVAAAGCGQEISKKETEVDGTTLALRLTGTDGDIVLEKVDYILKGSDGTELSGTADISSSTRPEFVVGRLLPGSYTITLSSTATDGISTCVGSSASFTIVAGTMTSITLPMTCNQPKRHGSLNVNGSLNVCPIVEDPSASPSEVLVGGSIVINAGAVSDPDQGPATLTSNWTALPPIGEFDSQTAATTTYHCTQSGAVTLKFTASDGDSACQSSGEVLVTCTAPGSCPQGTVWMPSVGGCGGSVLVPGATEHFASKIFTAGASPVVIEAVSSWASLTPDPGRQTSTGPVLVLAPYQGGSGCDFISYYPSNTFVQLGLDTLDPASTTTASIVVPPGVDAYIAGSDCYMPDDVLGEFNIVWKIVQ